MVLVEFLRGLFDVFEALVPVVFVMRNQSRARSHSPETGNSGLLLVIHVLAVTTGFLIIRRWREERAKRIAGETDK